MFFFSLYAFLQGPIGLDGPKGEPVSALHTYVPY